MNTIKLREALKEIQAHQAILLEAEVALKRLIAMVAGEHAADTAKTVSPDASPDSIEGTRSYIDDAVAALEREGRAIHVKKLCEGISASRGVEVRREAVESSIIRHISKAKQPRLAKFGPSTYGLPSWKEKPATLVDIAQAS